MNDKNYVGSGWLKTFDNGGSIINISLKLEDLQKLPAFTDKSGNNWVKLTVAPLKMPNVKSGATHSVYENNYKKQEPVDNTRPPVQEENDPF